MPETAYEFDDLEWREVGVGTPRVGDFIQFTDDAGNYPDPSRRKVHIVRDIQRLRPDDEWLAHVLVDPATGEYRDVIAEHDSNYCRVARPDWRGDDGE